MDATKFGLFLVFLYPPLVLVFDVFLVFALRKLTISEHIWLDDRLRWAICVYIAVWAVLLILHFGWKWFRV